MNSIIRRKLFNNFLAFILWLCLAFNVCIGLKCHCDICPKDSNHTCETDGLCFASTAIDDNNLITHSYRCLHKSDLFPPENPIICQQPESINNRFVIKCCAERDYCNLNLKPTLTPPIPTTNDADHHGMHENKANCGQICPKTKPTKIRPQTGKIYAYNLETNTLINAEESHSVGIKARVEITSHNTCEHSLRLREVQLIGVPDAAPLQKSLEANPIQFGSFDGKVSGVCSVSSDEKWVIDIKKAIISSLQISAEDLFETSTVIEDDFSGRCNTTYRPLICGVLVIEKIKDLKKCENRITFFGVHAKLFSVLHGFVDNYVSDSTRTQKCVQKMKDNIITKVYCEEEFTAEFKNNQSFRSSIDLKLIETTDSAVVKIDELTAAQPLFYINDEVEEEVVVTESDVLKILEKMCTELNENFIPLEMTSSFHSLTKSLKTLGNDATQRLYSLVKLGEICSSPKLKELFIYGSAFAASDSSIKTVINAYRDKEFSETTAMILFTIISNTAKPTEETISALSPMIESKQTARPLLFGISNLIRSFCKTVENCEEIPVIMKSVQDLINRIKTSDSNTDAITCIKALENLKKISEPAKSSLLGLSQNTSTVSGVRVAAIQALTKISDDQIREALIEIFLNNTEEADIRIAAYKSVVISGATVAQLEKIKSVYNYQISHYVRSHIKNIKDSQIEKLQQLLPPNAPEFGEPKPQRIENFMFSENGLTIEGDIIRNNYNYLSTLTVSVWAKIYGKHKQLIEISIRNVGLDNHINRIKSGIYAVEYYESLMRLGVELLFDYLKQTRLQISVKLLGRSIIFTDYSQDIQILNNILKEKIRQWSRLENFEEIMSDFMLELKAEMPTLNGFPLLFQLSDTDLSGIKGSLNTETTGDSTKSNVIKIQANPSLVSQLSIRSSLKVANYRPGVEFIMQTSFTPMIDVLVETKLKTKDMRVLKAKINLPKGRHSILKLTETTRMIDFNGQPKESNEVLDNGLESNEENNFCTTSDGMVSLCLVMSEDENSPNVEYYIRNNDKSIDSIELVLEGPSTDSKDVRLWTAKLSPSNSEQKNKTLTAEIEYITPSEGRKELNIKLKSPQHSLTSKSLLEYGRYGRDGSDGRIVRIEIQIQCPNYIDIDLKTNINETENENNVEVAVDYKLGDHPKQESIKWIKRYSYNRTEKLYNISVFSELISTQYPFINNQINLSIVLGPKNKLNSELIIGWNKDFIDKIRVLLNVRHDIIDWDPMTITFENNLIIEAKPYDLDYGINLNVDCVLSDKGKLTELEIVFKGNDLEDRDESDFRLSIYYNRIETKLSHILNVSLNTLGREMAVRSNIEPLVESLNHSLYYGLTNIQLQKDEIITCKGYYSHRLTNTSKYYKYEMNNEVSYTWKPDIYKHRLQLDINDNQTVEIKELLEHNFVKDRESFITIKDNKEVNAYIVNKDRSVEININNMSDPTEVDFEVKNNYTEHNNCYNSYKCKLLRVPKQSLTVKLMANENCGSVEFESHISFVDNSSIKLYTSEGLSVNGFVDIFSKTKRYHMEVVFPKIKYSHFGDIQYLTKENKFLIDSRTNTSGKPYLTIEGQLTCKERSFLIIKKIKSPDNVSKFEYFYDNGKYGAVLDSSRYTVFAEGERYPTKSGKFGFFDKTENYELTSNYSLNNNEVIIKSISSKDKEYATLDAVLGTSIVSYITYINPKVDFRLNANPLANPKTLKLKYLSDRYDQKTDIEFIPNNQIKINSYSERKVEPMCRMSVEVFLVRDMNSESSVNISVPRFDLKFKRTSGPIPKHTFNTTIGDLAYMEEYYINSDIHPIENLLINLTKYLSTLITCGRGFWSEIIDIFVDKMGRIIATFQYIYWFIE